MELGPPKLTQQQFEEIQDILAAQSDEVLRQFEIKKAALVKEFALDMVKAELRVEFVARPEFIKAWEKLINTGLRTNIKWLETTSKWIDDGLELTSSATKVTIKKAGVEVGEISGDLLKVKYSGLGGDVVCHSTKTTTVVGRWPSGTENIWNSGLAKQGNNPSGVNVLGNVDLSPPPNLVWANQNKPWLDEAIQRNDVIRAVSEPINIDNVFFFFILTIYLLMFFHHKDL